LKVHVLRMIFAKPRYAVYRTGLSGRNHMVRNDVPSIELKKNVQDHEGVPENFENPEGRPCLFILDHLLNEVYLRAVCELFTKSSHHRNLSVILITQNFFHEAPHCRDISLNAKYLVALKNVRDRNQFAYLARQILPEDSASLCAAYKERTRNAHFYLIIRFHAGYKQHAELSNQCLSVRISSRHICPIK